VQLVSAASLGELFPRLAAPELPFMAGYGIAVASLDRAVASLQAGEIAFQRDGGYVVAPFPEELGLGAWVFVEIAPALPWRVLENV
jgi:hypothetical protein